MAGFSSQYQGGVEQDQIAQSFAQWLSELKSRNNRALQEMLSETSIIRDSITSNNMELTDLKRHSSGISQQMQTQLTDLREKLTSAFGEITSLVKQKTQSDSEMMQDINTLQQNLSQKTHELEALKKSYSQAHSQLQSSVISIQNHIQVTQSDVQAARAACDKASRGTEQNLSEVHENVKNLMHELNAGNNETRSQMMQLKDEISRIQNSLSSVTMEFSEYKRQSNAVHNKLQSQVWGLEEGRKGQDAPQAGTRQPSYNPGVTLHNYSAGTLPGVSQSQTLMSGARSGIVTVGPSPQRAASYQNQSQTTLQTAGSVGSVPIPVTSKTSGYGQPTASITSQPGMQPMMAPQPMPYMAM
eukprot:TRINITY_DN83291_c0_g1_i1.p1 TRINITY_DN83291_c0_g1~~TRINITY_DN83291_c0_g1_i1.p1  ORF type:complete len:357 (-),score=63.53 TRINITY_DN83291_c0_g1_i1:95-1165(-)